MPGNVWPALLVASAIGHPAVNITPTPDVFPLFPQIRGAGGREWARVNVRRLGP
jgi:hypothetical protein